MCLHGSNRRCQVFRCPGEWFAQGCFSQIVSYGSGSIMTWIDISVERKTDLVFVSDGNRRGVWLLKGMCKISLSTMLYLREDISGTISYSCTTMLVANTANTTHRFLKGLELKRWPGQPSIPSWISLSICGTGSNEEFKPELKLQAILTSLKRRGKKNRKPCLRSTWKS